MNKTIAATSVVFLNMSCPKGISGDMFNCEPNATIRPPGAITFINGNDAVALMTITGDTVDMFGSVAEAGGSNWEDTGLVFRKRESRKEEFFETRKWFFFFWWRFSHCWSVFVTWDAFV